MPIIVEPSLPEERYPRVAFVEAPTPDAAVRFDFNTAGVWADEDVWPDHDGFSIGVPQFEGEPDGIGVELGLRELSFNLIVKAHDAAAVFPIAVLSRELQRSRNWLVFQKSPHVPPMWFRTFRSQVGELDFEHVYNDREGQWYGVGVSLAAEPFAYGERRTLGPFTINNSPTAATNPLHVVLPEIVGDAPTPLRIRAKVSDPAQRAGVTHRLAATPAPPVVATVGTLGVDTALNGDGKPEVSFASTPGMARRVTYSGPTVPHGRYQVFASLRRTTSSTSTYDFQLTDLASAGARVVSSTTSGTITSATTVYNDLGTIDLPIGARVDDEFLDGGSAPARFALSISRTSGTSPLVVDHLLLVPVDLGAGGRGELARIAHGTSAETVDAAIIDSDTETARLVDASGAAVQLTTSSRVTGGFPSATPGAVNAITYLSSVSATTEVTVSYAPRYLYLAGY